jgi:quinol monooxygenase YgiN
MSDASQERHLIVEFRCKPENMERVKGLLLEFIGPARQEEGCLYYDLYQNIAEPTRFFILDGWTDQTRVDRHGQHPNVSRVLEKLLPLLSEPVSITPNLRLSEQA